MKFGALVGMLLVAGAASAGSDIQGQLSSDTTWTLAGSPYTLTGDLLIPSGLTLTIEPGVVVIAAATDRGSAGADKNKVGLISRGHLRVLGTGASPVTFKGATPGVGAWRGIRVETGSAGSTTFSNVLIRDAAYGLDVFGSHTSVTFSSSTLTANGTGVSVSQGASLAMDHSLIYSNTSHGVSIRASTATLLHDTITSNATGVSIANASTEVVTVRDSIIAYNSLGISCTNGRSNWVRLSHNDVWKNSSANYANLIADTKSFSANPLFVSATHLRLTAHSPARHAASDGTSDMGALPYTGDPTPFLAGTLHEDTTLSGDLSLEGDLTVPAGVTLLLAHDTTLTVATRDVMDAGLDKSRVELILLGTLRVKGSVAHPITFKAATPGVGQWYGVRVEKGTATIVGALFRDAVHGLDLRGSSTSVTLSSSTVTGNDVGIVFTDQATLAMDHCLVHTNTFEGVSIGDANGALHFNTIALNGRAGIVFSSSSRNKIVAVSNSIVTQNGGYGVGMYVGSMRLSYNDVWNNGDNYYNVTEGPHSFSANPRFVSTSDFHLQETSPCRGAGANGQDLGAFSER